MQSWQKVPDSKHPTLPTLQTLHYRNVLTPQLAHPRCSSRSLTAALCPSTAFGTCKDSSPDNKTAQAEGNLDSSLSSACRYACKSRENSCRVGDETLPTDALPTNLTDAFAHSCKLTWPVHCLKAGRQCKIPASLVKIPEVTLKASKIRIQNIKELMQVCSICTSRSIC